MKIIEKKIKLFLEKLFFFNLFILCILSNKIVAQSYHIGDLIINSDGSQGIVFFVHQDGSGGWMVALTDSSSGCSWGTNSDITDLNNINQTIYPGFSYTSVAIYDTAGYSNTQKIRAFQNNNNSFAAGKVDFENGWYLPSLGQLSELFNTHSLISTSITNAGGSLLSQYYWSSTEYDSNKAWLYGFPTTSSINKTSNNISVRAIRNFTCQSIIYDTTLSYLWSTGSSVPHIVTYPNASTTYSVTVTSEMGCTNSASQTIFVNSIYPQVLYDTVCLGSSYIENGFDIGISDTQTVGTTLYTQTIIQNGCQATVHLYLFRKSNTSATLDVSLCEGEQYILNGVEYYTAGTYHQNLYAQNGCDSLLTLNLSFYPNPNTIIQQTSCNYYSWNGVVYSQTGIYTQIFSNQNGCDSTVILHLTIFPSSSSTITQIVNQNQLPITFNGQIFTNDVNNYLITIQNTNGCDSVITYNLVVNWNTTTQLQDTICQNSLPFIWNGATFNGPGIQNVTFTSFNGADSIVNMSLIVLTNTTSTITQIVNENQLPIIFNGHVFNGDVNNYLITVPNANGCDSIISYNIQVNWNTSSFLIDHVCESSLPYIWNGVTFYNSMIQTTTLTSYTGADSLVTMKLEVIPNSTFSFIQTVNEDQLPITFNGESFSSEVSNYLIIISNASGCDSLIYYTLNIIWANSIQISDTICQNSLPYIWNGFTFNNAGTHNAYLTSSTGEDSIVMMTLIVNQATYSTITQTVNENQLPYTYNGHVFTNEVDYYPIMINNLNGCDSVITFSLNINWNTSNHIIHSICQNSLPYVWNGITFNAAGNQYDTLTSFNGADSIITMTLVVHPNTSSIISETVNENQLPFNFNGVLFSDEVTQYLITISNSNGCDSVISYTLYINWNTSNSITDTICENSLPYVWNGITFHSASTQSVILTSYNGADSVLTMTLYIYPITTSSVTQTVIENQLPVTFNGQTFYYEVVNSVFTLNNANGCDSLIFYTLHVHWNTINLISETICQDDLPYMLNGITFYTSGTQTDTLLSVFGSDSIVTTTLVVHPNTTSTITQTVNENQLPITFNEQTFTGEVVNYVIALNNANGCDSVIQYTLHVNWNTIDHIFDTICQNSLPYVWNGVTFNNPGTQSATLISYTGADSVVTMTLFVHPNTTSTITQTVNENQLPITFNGQTFNGEVVNYVLTINNANGCDSVITFTLHVNWNTYSTIDTTICSYNLPINWRGFTFTQESVVYDTTLNANNTQHFITYFVDVDTLTNIQFSGFTNPVCPSITSQQITANITTGISPYSYYWSGDSIISSSQNQTLVKIAPSSCGTVRKIYLEVQDQIGCIVRDSIYIQISTNQAPSLSSPIPALNSPVTNCQFSVPNLDSLVRSHSVDNCYPSDSLKIIQNPLAGTAILSTTNINITISNPCGNSIQTTVSVIVPTALSTSINNITHVSCFGQTTGGATVVSSGGTPNYSYSWSTQSTPFTIISTTNAISNVAAGTYRVTVTDHSGCTTTSNVTILNQSTAMSSGDITANQSVCLGTSPALLTGTSATGGINSYYQWQKSIDNSIFSTANGTINTQNYTPSTLTQNTYFRRAWISVACGTVYSDTILITILPVYRDTIQGEVCRGTQYQSQGFNLPSDSTQITGVNYFTNHLTSFQNCDSIVVLQLNVLPDFENEYIANSCNSYIWNDITYTETGDYPQSFQAQNGCDSTVILHLMINSSQTTNITDTVCQGNSYDKNGFYITPPVTDILQIIEQEITMNNVLGCDSVVALSLTVFDTSMTLVLLSSNFCETFSAELMVQALFENYLWNTGEISPIITVDKPGYYTVTGFNNYCEKTANYTIQPCKFPIYLPNSFTPNGDGLNDYFSLTTFYADQIVEFNIVIFNRWGQKLFESYDPYFKWDGKFNNEMVMRDQIYNYLIKFRINGKGSQIIKGVVMVL